MHHRVHTRADSRLSKNPRTQRLAVNTAIRRKNAFAKNLNQGRNGTAARPLKTVHNIVSVKKFHPKLR